MSRDDKVSASYPAGKFQQSPDAHGSPEADLRVRRTRKMLQDALIGLTIEKGFTGVTVREIAERAMVNRATFYRHYQDKYDLLDQYMDEIYRLTFADEEASFLQESISPTDQPPAGLVQMLKHVERLADFFRVMLGRDGDPTFARKVQNYIEKRFRVMIGEMPGLRRPDRPPIDLYLSYVSHAGVGGIVWWLENNRPCTAEQLAKWMAEISDLELNLYRQE